MYGIDTIRKLNETLVATTATTIGSAIDVSTEEFISSADTDKGQESCKCDTEIAFLQVEAPTVKEVSLETWDTEIVSSPLPVIIDFYANWCGPCDLVAPIIEHLVGELGNIAKFAKIDVDQNLEIAHRYNVRSIPTIIIFRSGEELARTTGAQSKEKLTKFITSQISKDLGEQST
jgi:thioredoxin 1